MKKNKLIANAFIAITLLSLKVSAVHAQQLVILYTGNTQGAILPLLK